MYFFIKTRSHFLTISLICLSIFHCSIPAYSQWHVENFGANDGIYQNSILSIVQTENGVLLIGTMGGLFEYNGINFKLLDTPGSKRIFSLFQNKEGNVFFYNSEYKLYQYLNQQCVPIDIEPKIKPILHQRISSKLTTEEIYNLITVNRQWLAKDADGDYTLLHPIINTNFFQFKGAMLGENYLKVTPKGFSLIDRTCGNIALTKPKNLQINLNDLFVNGKFFSYKNKMYFIYNCALFEALVINQDLIINELTSHIDELCGLIHTIFVADTDNSVIYVGTDNKGLFKFTKKQFKTLTANKYIHSANSHYAHLEVEPGVLMTANQNIFKNDSLYKLTKWANSIGFLLKDNTNRIWANIDDKITILDQNYNKVYFNNLYCFNHFCSMVEYNHQYYNGNSNTFNLFEFCNDSLTTVFSKKLDPSAIIERITHQDDKTQIWTRKGMYIFNNQNHTISKSSLPDLYYRNAFSTSRSNEQIITTYGNGWYYLKNDSLVGLPLDNLNFLSTAHEILRDKKGALWVSTNNGLFQIFEQDIFAFVDGTKEHIYMHRHTKQSGFNTDEFNGGRDNCAIKLSDGRFSFSTIQGLVQFDPLKIIPHFPTDNLEIKSVVIDEKPESFTNEQSITLKPDFKSIKFSLSTIHFDQKDNLYMYYRIKNADLTWKKLDPSNLDITLLKLAPGDYFLEIKKLTGFGKDNHIIKEFKITVLPFWYQTFWGIALMISAVLLIIYIINLINTKRLAIQKQHLEKLITARNHELILINQELTETLSHNDMLMSVIVHDIKSPVKFISDISNEMLEQWEDIIDAEKKSLISSIKKSSIKISAFIQNFLTWTKSKKEKSVLKDSLNLNDLVNEIFSFYQANPKVIKNNIKLCNEIPDQLTITQNRQLLHIILNNLVENSLKFTQKGAISIHYQNFQNEYIISCSDTGKGLTASEIKILLSEQYSPNALRSDSFRLGYFFIKDILPMIHGTLHITSTIGNGTTVALKFNKK